MSLADNIKNIREEKNLKQIEVATHIGVDKSAYSKIEKGLRSLTVDELQKMAGLFDMTTDQIINFDGKIPKEVVLEDKTAVEQMKLIQQLDAYPPFVLVIFALDVVLPGFAVCDVEVDVLRERAAVVEGDLKGVGHAGQPTGRVRPCGRAESRFVGTAPCWCESRSATKVIGPMERPRA